MGEIVDMDKMHYGFMPSRGTVDQKLCYIDFEVFNEVLQKVICYALRKNDVSECLVQCIMSLYNDCKITFSVDGELSDKFSFFGQVGVHQGSVLSALL